MKKTLLALILIFGINLQAQIIVKGYVSDNSTNETLIGATIISSNGTGTVTDFNGFYQISLPEGKHELSISYVGYGELLKIITLYKETELNFSLSSEILNEVELISDIARSRETPVAFSNIGPKQLQEELAGQDIPLILNSTPGVYATQSGGGDGDARISIRGFNQRNVAVMVDGIPMNDMENGWVYWSNWFGLDVMTKTIQVQRGLGASKLSIPAVGGTMNILTKGIDSKKGLKFSQDFGNNGYLKSTIGFNSGKLKNGWGYSLAASYKEGDGWVDQTWTQGIFYYLKIQKKIKNHRLSFTAFGAPQSHGQRSYKQAIALYDKSYAADLGIDTTGVEGDFGLRYNEDWGRVNRYTVNFDEDGNAVDTIFAENENLSSRMNYYHKPQISLNHLWAVNNKLVVSNVLYVSLGNGGGTSPSGSSPPRGADNQIDFQNIYDLNSGNTRNSIFGPPNDPSIDPSYSATEHKSTQFIRSSINNHRWFGLLSTYNYESNDKMTLSGGIDLRHYTGEHYREVHDLLGGDYYVAPKDEVAASNSSSVIQKGDKYSFHNDGLVKWAGVFQQMEYKAGNWTAFANISLSNTGYKRIDYFKPLDLVLGDTTYLQALSFGDTITHDGLNYTVDSEETRASESDWKWIPGYTIKTGFNYNIDEYNNAFMNIGYLEKAPKFRNIFDFDNQLFEEIRNEEVYAIEFGHSYNSPRFSTNLNLYRTQWNNKPQSGFYEGDGGERINYNINGINALHQGIEIDASFRINKDLTLQVLSSIGDWRWNSSDSIRSYDDSNTLLGVDYFDATGVHVGDAAQLQIGSSIRYSPLKNGYITIKAMHYDNHYADFNPLNLKDGNEGRDSWKIPAYELFDLHAGYRFDYQKVFIDLKFNVLNVFDTTYISDARNNDPYTQDINNFDAASASVFFGMGRRFTTSFKLSF